MLCWSDIILCLSYVFQIPQFIFYVNFISKLHNSIVEQRITNNGMHNLDIVKLKFPPTKLYRFEYYSTISLAQCQQITADVLIEKVFFCYFIAIVLAAEIRVRCK